MAVAEILRSNDARVSSHVHVLERYVRTAMNLNCAIRWLKDVVRIPYEDGDYWHRNSDYLHDLGATVRSRCSSLGQLYCLLNALPAGESRGNIWLPKIAVGLWAIGRSADDGADLSGCEPQGRPPVR